ncbi:MAG: HAMP domain-containing methyl-accepting chemotaxis protein [Solirubrobacterales bacterium]
MTQPNTRKSQQSRAQRLLPQWFLDLDAARKPYVIVGLVLVGIVPLLALAINAGADLKNDTEALNELLSRSHPNPEALQAAAETIHNDWVRYAIGMIGAAVWALVIAVGGARVTAHVAHLWVRDLTDSARRIAAGDLSIAIERDNGSQVGDIQESMGKMIASFRATVTRIERAASELTEAAGEMAETSENSGRAIGEVAQSISAISEGAAHQVSLITDASGVVGEIERSVVEAARNASASQQESAQTQQLTEIGVERATEIQLAMQTVRDATHSTVEMVRSLSETSADIDEIVRAITGIAGQTNLLALNAAIEAARAGEQGRGFAVVAEEVRKLAEDSERSASGIAELIDAIQLQTEQAVAAMEEGMGTVDRGFDAVSRNRQLFFDISGAVRLFHESSVEIAQLSSTIAGDAGRVRERIEEVASVAQESSASTEQVSASTQQTSASSQELTAAAQRVSQTAVALKELAARFSTDNNGSAA